MRDTVRDIDNETDLHAFVRAQRAPPRPNEIKYEQHPTLAPKTQQPTLASTTQETREANTSTWPQSQPAPQSQQRAPTFGLNNTNGAQTQASSMGNRYDYLGAGSSAPRLSDEYAQRPSTAGRDVAGGYPQQNSTFMGNAIMGQPQQQQAPAASYNERYTPQSGAPNLYSPHNTTNYDSNEKNAASAPPYPTNPSERTMQSYTSPPQQQTTGSIPPPASALASTRQYAAAPTSTQQPYPPAQTQSQWQPQPQSQSSYPQQTPTINNNNSAPQRPIFGVPLEDLFQRDQTAIPFLVAQAILAIDAFGLETEGIYRTPGNTAHVAQLKAAFDHAGDNTNNSGQQEAGGPALPANLDFRNPANFHQDINAVTSLLKLFFKSLPDPLFTSAAYKQFLEAGRIDIPEQRRDALHALINELPDPNYATLRALVLHLSRVAGREERNRMGSGNLGVCLG